MNRIEILQAEFIEAGGCFLPDACTHTETPHTAGRGCLCSGCAIVPGCRWLRCTSVVEAARCWEATRAFDAALRKQLRARVYLLAQQHGFLAHFDVAVDRLDA